MEIRCEKRYQEALDYAAKTDDKTLQKCLEHLRQKEIINECEIILCYDRSPPVILFRDER